MDIFRISADGSHVLYTADEEVDGALDKDLYGVPIDGHSARVKLNDTVDFVLGARFATTPDGTRVLYIPDPWSNYDGNDLWQTYLPRPAELGPTLR